MIKTSLQECTLPSLSGEKTCISLMNGKSETKIINLKFQFTMEAEDKRMGKIAAL
jgi:hypothetical protein